jgi:hypothetical protein
MKMQNANNTVARTKASVGLPKLSALLIIVIKLLNQSVYDRLMECLITSLRFKLFENIIHMELDSTLVNNEAIGNVEIAMSLLLVRSPILS